MLVALTTKINSAIVPLRLVYRAERPIDRRLRSGFFEAADFSVINVACAGFRQTRLPLISNLVGGFRGRWPLRLRSGQARATQNVNHKTKGAG
jgi:hypothetical protein